jgi:hypothetical protein
VVTPAAAGVQVTDSDLVVNFGTEFSAHVSRSAIAGVQPVADPRPGVYFPMGLSAAVDKLGRDTVCIVTSYTGLVQVDFRQEVQGEGRPVERRRESSLAARPADGYEPPSALRTWGRVIGVIVALVIIVEAIINGFFLWVIVAAVVILLALGVWSWVKNMREREAQRSQAPVERTVVPFRHLIVSVEDPDGLMRALSQRGAASAAT